MTIAEFDVAVLPGDGIGKEIAGPSVRLVNEAGRQFGVAFKFETLEASAARYDKTGVAFPEESFQRAASADAINLCAMGLPDFRCPDGTEVGPQHNLRKRLLLYAGVPSLQNNAGHSIVARRSARKEARLCHHRVSTEGLFAFPRGHEFDDEEHAHNLLRVSRTICHKLFDFSFRLARRRQQQGISQNLVTHIDKANVLSSQHRARQWLYDVARQNTDVRAAHQDLELAGFDMVRRPWVFDVMPTENQYGDILSDLASALMGGMGMAPSADVGDSNAVFQPCHGTRPPTPGASSCHTSWVALRVRMPSSTPSERS